MHWAFGIAAYVIIWWLVLFAVLPFGVRPARDDDPGHAAGAPANPRMALKAAVTTVIAGVIWLLGYWAITAGFLDFRGS